MNWLLLSESLYLVILVAVCLRIVYDTHSTVKTLAYLLFAIFIPFIGIFFYFSFGTNYRKKELYSKKIIQDNELWDKIKKDIYTQSVQAYNRAGESFRPNKHLVRYLSGEMSELTAGNEVHLLVNGEEKFPAVLEALEQAKDHIHMEYYIYENDCIGREIEEVLIRKIKEGLDVRFIYDDFGSRSIRKNIARRLKSAGVQVFPFYKIVFGRMANRLNYRNHRKIIVIDGKKGFVGGINVSDKYINDSSTFSKKQFFWRDTHLMTEGPAVHYLQYLFICDWNFCANEHVEDNKRYFPDSSAGTERGNKLIQIAASGPDSKNPTILYSLLYAISQAEEEILITTPYFIPDQSIIDSIRMAALGGVSVHLLVPEKSDSKLVEMAACSYYDDLLAAGVKLWFYRKGFVHAKTVVVDKKLAIIGTANMDYRSFDLNFEVNAIIFDAEFATLLAGVFEDDLKHSRQIKETEWLARSVTRKLLERTARLVSPLL